MVMPKHPPGAGLSPASMIAALGIAVLFGLARPGPLGAEPAMGLPTNVCLGGFCGPAQEEIWNRFQGASGLDSDLIPSVYSGICHHNSPSLDPDVRQFGAILLDQADGRVFFDGKFSFHKRRHPYAHLNVEAARRRFPEHHLVTLYDRFAYADASDTMKPFRYWFRQEAATEGLLLVGFFGYIHTILCALDRHSPAASAER